MLFRALLLALLPAVVLSEIRLNQTDIPQQCRSICQPVTNLTQTCNVSNSTGTATMSNRTQDLLERQCVCTNESFDVANRTSLCAGCIDQTANNSTGSSNSTGQMEISSIMSVCGFMSQSFQSNMTSATSANVTATRPTDTAALTTTISTGVGAPTGGWGGWNGGAGPDETAAPDAGTRAGASGVGILAALAAGVMMGL